MPIDIDEFESYDPDESPTNAERVVDFLTRNRDEAFRAVEIADATGVHEHSIHPVLGRLEESGVVRHKSPYWALVDDGEHEYGHEHGREGPTRRDRRGRGRDDQRPKPAVRRLRPDRNRTR